MKTRKRKFFLHYNKPLSQQRGCMMMTVHHAGVCHMVRHVVCSVPTRSRERRVQPRCVIEGLATAVRVEGETAHIE